MGGNNLFNGVYFSCVYLSISCLEYLLRSIKIFLLVFFVIISMPVGWMSVLRNAVRSENRRPVKQANKNISLLRASASERVSQSKKRFNSSCVR